jgi:hypothetical protein
MSHISEIKAGLIRLLNWPGQGNGGQTLGPDVVGADKAVWGTRLKTLARQ